MNGRPIGKAIKKGSTVSKKQETFAEDIVMSVYKRGGVWWYKFKWQGLLIRESTKQGSDRVARQMEAAHRTSLAKGEVGIREKKPSPTLQEFCERRFEPWAKATFEQTCLNNWFWFRAGIKRLTSYEPLANAKLDEITGEKLAGFVAYEQTRLQKRERDEKKEKRGLAVSSINSAIRVLRRVLTLAAEWGVIESAPKLSLLSGEHHREHVITRDEEARYLSAAPPLLAEVATVLADTGLRPDECHRMKWEEITWLNGRNGTLLVTHGKTKAARRVLPLTPRVRSVLEMSWRAVGKPVEGWVWPAPTQCGHIDHSSLKKQHVRALRVSKVRPFVLYNFRHTFLTRLGESGCDAWTLARIAGHSSIVISSRYVHPSEDSVLYAMGRLDVPQEGGHKSGHSQLQADFEANDGEAAKSRRNV
jgi:integrase